jgi:curved DNA-binding protein CbpA
MRLKDYYKILEVMPSASLQDIKKAYRRLAFQYHPDQNPGNSFASAHFNELHQAYSTLSHIEKRRKYDEERWLSGMSSRMQDHQIISPEWILKECNKLSVHMAKIDTHRMSHRSLHDYIFLILSDSHMAILQKNGNTDINNAVINEILKAAEHLQVQYFDDVSRRLMQLADTDSAVQENIVKIREKRKKQANVNKYQPLLIIIISLLLAVLMYWYGRKN